MQLNILVLYYSKTGATKQLAHLIASGVNKVPGVEAKVRTVPSISAVCESVAPSVPEIGAPYVDKSDLSDCHGLILGSPVHFGNMASPLKYFWDNTTDLWVKQALLNKPASLFTSGGSMHGGQESTLLSMMLPLLHHGMLIKGLPFVYSQLNTTTTGGTPYGVSHVAHENNPISADEKFLAIKQGEDLAKLVLQLNK